MHESVALIIEKQCVSFLLHIFGSALSLNLCSSLVCLVVRLKVAVCFHKFCVFSFLLRFGRRLRTKRRDGGRPVGVVFRGHHAPGPRLKRRVEAMAK